MNLKLQTFFFNIPTLKKISRLEKQQKIIYLYVSDIKTADFFPWVLQSAIPCNFLFRNLLKFAFSGSLHLLLLTNPTKTEKLGRKINHDVTNHEGATNFESNESRKSCTVTVEIRLDRGFLFDKKYAFHSNEIA